MRHPHFVFWIPLLLAASAGAQPTTAVSPQARARLEGSTSTLYPLGRAKARFQQLFGDLAGRIIKGHAYRRDALSSRGKIAAFQSQMAISMSTAALAPAKASTTFTQNAGQNPTSVLARTSMAFPATTKPTGLSPAPFLLRIPYKTAYAWSGKGTLCVEIVHYGNQTGSGQDKNFSADLDAHALFASGRNLQPGVSYGQGCPYNGAKTAAKASFLVRHLGKTSDLQIQVQRGVPSTASVTAESVLVLGHKQLSQAWPPGTGCTLYTDTVAILFLSGANDQNGGWSGTLPLGPPVTAFSSVFGQVASMARQTKELVLTNAAKLTMPPAGPGLISARIAQGTNPAATIGTVSYSVPITLFF